MWGIDFDIGKSGKFKVKNMNKNGQFAEKNVKIGWILQKVNNMEANKENQKQIANIIKLEQPCTILFNVSFLFSNQSFFFSSSSTMLRQTFLFFNTTFMGGGPFHVY